MPIESTPFFVHVFEAKWNAAPFKSTTGKAQPDCPFVINVQILSFTEALSKLERRCEAGRL